ncbi:MAG: hypothetical protein VW646_05480 [Hydrogenophilales bacterium]
MGKSKDLATLAANGLTTLKATNLEVDNIKNSSGTAAATIDSSGRIFKDQKIGFLARGYSSYVDASGSSATNTASMRAWTYQTIDYNHGNHFDNTNAVFTCPVAGTYLVSGGYGYKNGADHLGLYFFKNQTNIARNWSYNTFQHDSSNFTQVIVCAANDELRLCHHSGYQTPSTSSSNSYYAYYTAHLLI